MSPTSRAGSQPDPGDGHPTARARREVIALALPAFLALVAEPLFLLADAAIVGHLGTVPLAGLGVASAVLTTAANVFVFLAYGTTAVVARSVGAGSQRDGLRAGLDGVWLALLLGVVAAVLTAVLAGWLVGVFGASAATTDQALTYLRLSAIGIPGMLLVLATTGVLRGLQDTRTPLTTAVVGFAVNAVLNFALVFGLHLGIAGSAVGTVLAQSAMATALVLVVVRRARTLDALQRPHPARILRAGIGGVPLLVRTVALRGVLLLTTWAAARLGAAPLAAHQVAMTLWTLLTFALDALAIAGQALTAKALGAGDIHSVRHVTKMMLRWGLGAGTIAGVLLLALHNIIPFVFSSDPAVRSVLGAVLVVVALSQPLSGWVFVLDGVLIGSGDGRWLAGAQAVILLAYLPVIAGVRLLSIRHLGSEHSLAAQSFSLVILWTGFVAFMAMRAAALGWRARGDAWLVTGAARR